MVVMHHANVSVSIQGSEVEVVESFVYLGSLIPQVAASWKSSSVPLLSLSPCLLWIRITGVPQSRTKFDFVGYPPQTPLGELTALPQIS